MRSIIGFLGFLLRRVRLSVTSQVLEAGVGSLSLSCEVEANPAVTSMMWLRVDTGEVVR